MAMLIMLQKHIFRFNNHNDKSSLFESLTGDPEVNVLHYQREQTIDLERDVGEHEEWIFHFNWLFLEENFQLNIHRFILWEITEPLEFVN